MTKDIEKIRASRRKWYAGNKAKAKAKVFERRDEIERWFVEYRAELKCSRCPVNHPACLDFHHLDPATKGIKIAQAVHDGWSIERIKEEMSKCIVLCSNCHRIEHWDERHE